MQNLTPQALKLREEIEDDRSTNCKNAKFQTAHYGTKILLLIFVKLPLEQSKRGITLCWVRTKTF